MGSEQFIEKCKEIVKNYELEHLDKSDIIPEFEVFDVNGIDIVKILNEE